MLTYLIHLGYLAYDRTFKMAFIPNEEIRQELILATKRKKWNELITFQKESEQLLKDTHYPALVVELKWDKSVKAALDQIKDRKYPESVACYAGELLLVGINYDEKTKKHECWIEKYEKC